jgi:methionyl-tRNA synthetase
VNNELVAILGNFVNRVMVLCHKYFEGRVPNNSDSSDRIKVRNLQLLEEIGKYTNDLEYCLENFQFREAMLNYMNIARAGNKYLQDCEPWKLIKTDVESTASVLNHGIQICYQLALYGQIILPNMSNLILKQLNSSPQKGFLPKQPLEFFFVEDGHVLGIPEILFKPIEDADIDMQLAKLEASKQMNTAATPQETEPVKPEITFDDFAKTDIRVGTILEAERVPKTDKLLKLKIDTGLDQRTVVSGIAEYHKPEDIIGQQVCILINLAPRKMKGIESQGMILMAKDPTGKLVFVQPATLTTNGSGVA